jgi:hypothetical protein
MSEPRKYSEIKAEKAASDPEMIRRARIMDEIARLEAEARALQCEAEELRCGLFHLPR